MKTFTKHILLLALMLFGALGASAKVYTTLQEGDVIHVGDQINPGVKSRIEFNEWDYICSPGQNAPWTLVRADLGPYEPGLMVNVTESDTGDYYVFKNGDTYYFTEETRISATENSDGLVVTSLIQGNIPTATVAVHEFDPYAPALDETTGHWNFLMPGSNKVVKAVLYDSIVLGPHVTLYDAHPAFAAGDIYTRGDSTIYYYDTNNHHSFYLRADEQAGGKYFGFWSDLDPTDFDYTDRTYRRVSPGNLTCGRRYTAAYPNNYTLTLVTPQGGGTLELAGVTNEVNSTAISFTVPPSWDNDETPLTVDAFPGFVAVSEEQARNWTDAPQTGYCTLFYDTTSEGTWKTLGFVNGNIYPDEGDYQYQNVFNTQSNGYTVVYTTGGSNGFPYGVVPPEKTYNITFSGFNASAMNTTVSVTSLPQEFTQIGGQEITPSEVFGNAEQLQFEHADVYGGDYKVFCSTPYNMTITVSDVFEGTATIHVEGRYYDPESGDQTIYKDITVTCEAVRANGPYQVMEGLTVNVTATPDSAHYLARIDGHDTVGNYATGYSFVMPSSDKDLLATFNDKPTLTLTQTDGGTLEAIVPQGGAIENITADMVPANWQGDFDTQVTLADLQKMGFVATDEAVAAAWTGAPASGYAYLFFGFTTEGKVKLLEFWDGINYGPTVAFYNRGYIYSNREKFYFTTGTGTSNVVRTADTNTYIIDYGTPVTVVATPDAQHYLVRFSDDDNDTERNSNFAFEKTYDSVIADIPLSANFQAKPQLILAHNDGGTLTLDGYTPGSFTVSTFGFPGGWSEASMSEFIMAEDLPADFTPVTEAEMRNWNPGIEGNCIVFFRPHTNDRALIAKYENGVATSYSLTARKKTAASTYEGYQIYYVNSSTPAVFPEGVVAANNTLDTFVVNYGANVTVLATPSDTAYLVRFDQDADTNSNVAVSKTYTNITAPFTSMATFNDKPVLTLAANDTTWGKVTIESAGSAGGAGGEVTIGDGTTTSYVTPYYSLFNFSFVESLYTAEEIGTSGTITSISYNMQSTDPQTSDFVIYMKNVSRSTFASDTDYEPVTDADIVYSGSVTFNNGWTTITLGTPFEYDGTSNLMIAFDENSPGYSTRNFYYTNNASMVLAYRSDDYNPDPYNLGSYAGTKGRKLERANIKLDITPAATAIVALSDTTYRVDYGTEVKVIATPDSAHYFVNWTDSAAVNSNIGDTNTLTMGTDNMTLTANFAAKPTITLVANEGGVLDFDREVQYPYLGTSQNTGPLFLTDEPNVFVVDYGTDVTVKAMPEVHYHLEGWSCTPGTITPGPDSTATLDSMIADQTVTATFAQNDPELAWMYGNEILANGDTISAYDGFALDTIAKIFFHSSQEFYIDYMDSLQNADKSLLRFGSSNESVVSFLDEYDPMSISVNGPGTATVYMVHDGSVMAYDSAYFTAVILAPDTLTLVHNNGGEMEVELGGGNSHEPVLLTTIIPSSNALITNSQTNDTVTVTLSGDLMWGDGGWIVQYGDGYYGSVSVTAAAGFDIAYYKFYSSYGDSYIDSVAPYAVYPYFYTENYGQYIYSQLYGQGQFIGTGAVTRIEVYTHANVADSIRAIVTDTTYAVVPGANVTVKAMPDSAHYLVNFDNDAAIYSNTDTAKHYVVNGNVTSTATFHAKPTITLVASEGGVLDFDRTVQYPYLGTSQNTGPLFLTNEDNVYAVNYGASVTVMATPSDTTYLANFDGTDVRNDNDTAFKTYENIIEDTTSRANFVDKPVLTLAQGRALVSDDPDAWGSVTVEGAGGAGGDVTIGDSTSTTTSSYLPGYTLYDYAYSQQIYTADEIGLSGDITSLTMWLRNSSSYARNLEVYMKEVSRSEFANTSDWELLTSDNLVATGTMDNGISTPVNYTFNLTTPFHYSGTGNLLLCIRDVTGSWSSGLGGVIMDATGNQSLYAYRDGTVYDISNPGVSGTLLQKKNVVKFHIAAGSGAAAGITQLTDSTYRVDYGTEVTVNAQATELHHVKNWVDADSVAYPAADITYDNYFITTPEPLFPAFSTLTLTVTADTMTKAIFGINSYDVTAMAELDEREEIGTGLPMGVVEARYITIVGEVSSVDPAASIELTAQGGTTTSLTASPVYGYLFSGWYNGSEFLSAVPELTVTEAATLEARFVPDTFTVSATHTPADYGTVEGVGEYAYLTYVTVEAVPDYGYHFDHWRGGSTEISHTFQATKDTSFKAFFDINQYTVTVEAADSSMGSVSGTTTVDYLTEVEISAVANEHYSFVEWSDGETDATRTVVATRDTTYTAYFEPDVYTLTTASNNSSMGILAVATPLPAGVTATGNGTYSVVYGTELTVEATPTNRCFEMVSMSDGTEVYENDAMTFVMEGDLALTATFANHLFTSDTVADVCDLFVWNGVTYTETPAVAPRRDYTTADGCDSALVLDLTVRHSSTGDTAAATCSAFSWYEHINMTESQEVTHIFVGGNAEQCDSVVTLHLTVGSLATVDTVAVACDEFTWHGVTYTETPEVAPTYTYHSAAGCDSIVTLQLTLGHTTTGDTTAVACEEFTWHGVTYTETPEVAPTYTYQTAEGCDSVVTLLLTIGSDVQSDTTAVACDEFTWHGVTYTETPAVAPTYTYEATGGCSNTVTLHLTVNHTTYAYENVVTCDSYTWHGVTYTESTAPFGGPTYTTEGSNGCDSITTLHLTVNTTGSTVQTVTACDSYTWINGVTYTQSTGILDAPTYTVTGEDCDVVVTLHLTVNHSQSTSFNETVCEGYTWDGSYYAESGSYQKVYEGVNGCDSTVTLNLTVNQPTGSSEVVTTCAAYAWNGTIYTESGVYTYHTLNAAGCDSTATLLLIIGQAIQTTVNQTACDSYEWAGTLYTESGSYSHTYTTAAECDSIVTLNLTVNHSVSGGFTAETCGSYIWNGHTYAASGSYTQVLTTSEGCDSTVTLTLTVNEPVSTAVSATACSSYEWNGETYTTSGTYTYTTEAANGCDSTVTLTLTVNQPVRTSLVVTADGSYEWNGTVYTESGTYTYTTEAANGCDSVVTLNLTVNPLYTVTLLVNNGHYGSVNAGGTVVENAFFTAVATANDGYEFVSWMNGNEVVSTSAVYTFQVTEDITLTAVFQPSVGIDDVDMDNVTIYSTDSRIFVRGAEGHEVYIYDINGRIIDRELNAPETVEFRLTATGVYLVKVGNAPAKRVVVVR